MPHCSGSDWNYLQKSNFEGLLAMLCCPGSDWNARQKSNCEGLLAMSRCPGSHWSDLPKSNFEGLLAMWLCPGSDWNILSKSNSEGLLAMSRCPSSNWIDLFYHVLCHCGCLDNFDTVYVLVDAPKLCRNGVSAELTRIDQDIRGYGKRCPCSD